MADKDKIKNYTIGTFVLLTAVLSGLVVIPDDVQLYHCEDEGTVGTCNSLSAVNDDGIQTRCYYNESAPRSYNYCRSGWEPIEIDQPPSENEENNVTRFRVNANGKMNTCEANEGVVNQFTRCMNNNSEVYYLGELI